MTAEDIRARIVEVATANGGHLASSLGAVEIAMALADVFDPYRDRIVWDVGHQAYAWKILTGRAEGFSSLRKMGGVGPFPNPSESAADAAVAGHAGVSISVAAGFAAARDALGEDMHVVAVIGDASIANGTAFEAINNLKGATDKLVVVLNDNEANCSHELCHSAGSSFFERFGLHYMGPVDGHDLVKLKAAFTVAKEAKRSVIVHVVTRKGKGYEPAERDPAKYHGVPASGSVCAPGWSDAFGAALSELAREDPRIVALTAAMREGTGLSKFSKEFPRRFYDVGISEGHMVAFAAGLAAGGMRPVVAVYSTFLQRAVDQVMHDVCLPNLPVVLCVDRAGVVGADGATHQGLYDIAMLRCLPNLTICQPKDEDDLKALLCEALKRNGPTVIRYPRGAPSPRRELRPSAFGASVAIWATGDWFDKACDVADRVAKREPPIVCEVVHARYLKPFDEAALRRQRAAGMKIVSLENAAIVGGLGEALGADIRFGWPDEFVPHGSPADLERRFGLDVDSIVERLVAEVTADGRQPTAAASGKA